MTLLRCLTSGDTPCRGYPAASGSCGLGKKGQKMSIDREFGPFKIGDYVRFADDCHGTEERVVVGVEGDGIVFYELRDGKARAPQMVLAKRLRRVLPPNAETGKRIEEAFQEALFPRLLFPGEAVPEIRPQLAPVEWSQWTVDVWVDPEDNEHTVSVKVYQGGSIAWVWRQPWTVHQWVQILAALEAAGWRLLANEQGCWYFSKRQG